MKYILLFLILAQSNVLQCADATYENLNPFELKVNMSHADDNYDSVEFFLNGKKIISDSHKKEII